jgi:hypothetical protein
MERKVLITVGDDPNSLYGAHFVSSFFRNKGDMKLTLLHIAPAFESMEPKEGLRLHEMDQILSRIYAKKGHEALEMSKRILLSQDFFSHQISTKLIYKHYGMTRDILQEAEQGHYHAIALGRRGYSIFEKALYPRLSQEVMGLNIDFPLWVCRRPQRGLKNVLLCVDGSDSSLRAARHVGFMVGREEQHRITLLFVDDGSSKDVEVAFRKAKRELADHSIKDESVVTQIIEGNEVAKIILKESSTGSYAVVSVGQHGVGTQTASEKRFMGTNSLELIETLERAALWVCN